MSYTITIEAMRSRPALDGVTRAGRGERYKIYRAGESSRGVEVHEDPPSLSVRLVALASPEDWTLAYDFLTAAGDPGAVATGEDGTTGTCGGLADAFAEVMVRETAASLAGLEAALAQNPGVEIKLQGSEREVHLGPRLLRELSEPRALALIERVRRVQNVERDGFEWREAVPLRAPGVPVFTVWTPAKAQAFEPTEALGVSGPDGNVYVPIEALPALLGDRFHWLDEKQFALDAITDPDLLTRARAVGIDPYAKVTRKWWQFWKRGA